MQCRLEASHVSRNEITTSASAKAWRALGAGIPAQIREGFVRFTLSH
jgi:hypothetical protein